MGGTISDSNVRAGIVIDRQLYAKIKKLAQEQNRSFSNLTVHLLEQYLKQCGESTKE